MNGVDDRVFSCYTIFLLLLLCVCVQKKSTVLFPFQSSSTSSSNVFWLIDSIQNVQWSIDFQICLSLFFFLWLIANYNVRKNVVNVNSHLTLCISMLVWNKKIKIKIIVDSVKTALELNWIGQIHEFNEIRIGHDRLSTAQQFSYKNTILFCSFWSLNNYCAQHTKWFLICNCLFFLYSILVCFTWCIGMLFHNLLHTSQAQRQICFTFHSFLNRSIFSPFDV